MSYFLALQSTYTALEIALFQQNNCLKTITLDKIIASKEIILALENLLKSHSLALTDISFLVVNQGPGPFTTLRVLIATVNGLSFARKIPLVGINGLYALLDETVTDIPTLALLNAFHNDVYYALRVDQKIKEEGCTAITELLNYLATTPYASILCIGNGASLYATSIAQRLGSRAQFLGHSRDMASLMHIGLLGWQQWQKKEGISNQLQPLYLKAAKF